MAEYEIDKARDLAKKKILAILPPNLEMYGEIYNVKLYSCDKEGKNWLYSDVEGFCCIIIDYQVKSIYINIFDPTSFEKSFQFELYNSFLKYFEELAPDFRSFVIDSGFMGIRFENEEDATTFESVIKRLTGLKGDLFSKPRKKDDNAKQNEERARQYCTKLKEIFGAEDKYDENYAEDGTTILKHNNFKILANISYDKETKQFKFGKISEELKEMFLSFGIKKKELERDTDFAFTLFKKVIVGLGNENKLKNSALDSIEHVFPPPEEREIIRKQEEIQEAKMNSLKTKRRQTKQQNKQKTKPPPKNPTKQPKPKPPVKTTQASKPVVVTSSTAKGVPPPPPPPPPPPSVPKSVPNVPVSNPSNSSKKEPEKQVDLLQELNEKKGALTSVPKPSKEQPTTGDKMIQGSGKNFLQNALSTAIRNRRNNLHMHDDEDNDDEDDDWD